MKRLMMFVLTALLLIGGLATKQSSSVKANESSLEDLKSGWAMSAIPYIDKEYTRKPVVVKSVTFDTSKEPKVTEVKIASRSKTVRSVKLRWYVSAMDNQGVVVVRGETAEIQIVGGISAGNSQELRYDVISLNEIQLKLKDAKSDLRNFRIDVGIAEAKFEDAQSWSEPIKAKLDYMTKQEYELRKAAYNPATGVARTPVAFDTCIPNYRSCVWSTEMGGYYTCTLPNPAPVMCIAEVSTCTVTYCG